MSPATRRSFFKTRSPFCRRPCLVDPGDIRSTMVDDILGLAAVNDGSVTRDDLLSIGWTGRQIDLHAAAARERAAARASRPA